MTYPVRRAAFAAKRLTFAAFTLAAALIVSPALSGGRQDWVGTWMASPQPTWGSDFALPVRAASARRPI